eukprot:879367-Prymnesium_polylepis.1
MRRQRRGGDRDGPVGGRRDDGERLVKVGALDDHGGGVNLVLVSRLEDLRIRAVQRAQRRLGAKGFQVGAAEAVRAVGERRQERR